MMLDHLASLSLLAVLPLMPFGLLILPDQSTDIAPETPPQVIITTWAGDTTDAYSVNLLLASLRSFGGQLKNASCLVFTPPGLLDVDSILNGADHSGSVEVRHVDIPEIAKSHFYAFKVFAAAEAERSTAGKTRLLIFLDPDVVIVREPTLLLLDSTHQLGCRPVMHKLIGSAWDSPPDQFWRRVYDLFAVSDDKLYPMTTPVDEIVIRPYVNAGLLSVRPELGLFRRWSEYFLRLCNDSTISAMCFENRLRAIFLHQVALAAATLNTIDRDKLTLLPVEYNYPLNLQDKITPNRRPKSFDDLVVLRHDLQIFDESWRTTAGDSSAIWRWMLDRMK